MDVMTLNQEACVASRYQFVEGQRPKSTASAPRCTNISPAAPPKSGDVRPMAMDMKEEIEALMMMDDEYGVWGKTDGKGLVIRSDEPVDFHPINKTANVVRVDSLDDAVKWVNVATQTVGFYPFRPHARLSRPAGRRRGAARRPSGRGRASHHRQPARRHVSAAPFRPLDGA